jgi:hypothetical protein
VRSSSLDNFQSHRTFCSLVKLRHVDGEQLKWRGFFSTRRTNICT